MASIHTQDNSAGRTYRVRWRDGGRQQSLQFENLPSAERFKSLLQDHGPEEALRVVELEEAGRSVKTVRQFLTEHIDSLTGVQPATVDRYRTYVSRDVTFGDLPITAVTEHTIAKWVQGLQTDSDGNPTEVAGKTVANKHGFLSGAFNEAVKQGLINANPCQGRRLPHTRIDEMVFLTAEEFQLLADCIKQPRWRNLATFLVMTGMRFGEASALTPQDIDPQHRTARVIKSWKYTGSHKRVLGPPKTKMSVRTISLPQRAWDVVDLTQPEWLFTNSVGNPATPQEFYNRAWKPARDAAIAKGLTKSPRVHDLRHTCASWMVQNGVPLPVVQKRLGHESVQTTISIYSHFDTRDDQAAASVLDAAFDAPKSL